MGNSLSALDFDCCTSKRGASRIESHINTAPSRRGASHLPSLKEDGVDSTLREERVGVGAYFQRNEQDEFEVRSMLPGGAAERSGMILQGDVLLKIDGMPVRGPSMTKLVSLLLGDEGSEVQLTMCRNGQRGGLNQPFDVKLVRGALA
mmetsp:Transcript_18655/g.45908  ORF Transcript_18655/g.45908 Transcript_18655/m.45908 type:complete len:148 (-) Transcript_18655:469-912(-)